MVDKQNDESLTGQYLAQFFKWRTYNIFSNGFTKLGALAGLPFAVLVALHPDVPQDMAYFSAALSPVALGAFFGAAGSLVKERDSQIAMWRGIAEKAQSDKFETRKQARDTVRLNSLNALEILVETVEKKEFYTKNHASKVAFYSKRMANLFEKVLSQKQIDDMCIAAKLCDVGMIFVPEDIKNKKGKLTDAEFEVIKKHPVYSEDFLKTTGLVDDFVLRLVRGHHERYDGQGYPDGKKGYVNAPKNEKLDLYQLIFHVAQAYVSMTEERPHRAPISDRLAKLELYEQRGKQFDPDVVSLFIHSEGENPEDYARLNVYRLD